MHILCVDNFAHHRVHCFYSVGGEVLQISGNPWSRPLLKYFCCQEAVKKVTSFPFSI